MMILRRSLVIVLVVVGLLAAASVGVAERDNSYPAGSDIRQVETIESEIEGALSVFRRDRTSIDVLPDDVAAKLDERADYGMNPALSRLAIGNTTSSVYVIPGREHACASLAIVGKGAGFSCRAIEDLAAGRVGAATAAMPEGVGVWGLVPDGVKSVSVRTATAGHIDSPVENNAYYAVIPYDTPVRSIGYVGPGGPVEFPIFDPSGAFEE